jgi:hypothetical protein
MGTINVGYLNNDDAAHSVFEYIKDFTNYGLRFVLRPFDFHRPDDTEWWFIPGDEWPAYRYPKLIIESYPPFGVRSRRFMGYHVEHGYPHSLEGPEVNRSKIMQTDWGWFKFLQQVEIGRIYETIRKVRERTNTSIRLFIDASIPSEGHISWVEYEFTQTDDELNVMGFGQGSLEKVCLEKSFKKLLRLISLSKEINFLWLDIYIGVLAEYGKQEADNWKTKEVWHKALEPWCEVIMTS